VAANGLIGINSKVVDGQFVIDQQGASAAAIRQTVAACPSGALQIIEDKP
jgi:hypothetical protein